MRIIALTLTLLITSLSASAVDRESHKSCHFGPFRVAVIDTGFGYLNRGHDAKLCKYGHKDFSIEKEYINDFVTKVPVPKDTHSHGTNVVGLIKEYAGDADYCFVIIKYYSDKQTSAQNALASSKALQYANNLKVDILNYSGGGPVASYLEQDAIKQLLKRGAHIIAAAGNDNLFLDGLVNSYYPAMYDKRIKVVGNLNYLGIKADSSNYGPFVNTWEYGTNQNAYEITMTGTSQATAIVTGKTVASLPKTCDK